MISEEQEQFSFFTYMDNYTHTYDYGLYRWGYESILILMSLIYTIGMLIDSGELSNT